MSTVKLADYFASLNHEPAAFSFTVNGHSAPQNVKLFKATAEGGSCNRENLAELEVCLRSFAPQVVINHMPYDGGINSALCGKERDFVLLGCLRNTLFSVKGDLDGFIEAATPRFAWRLLKSQVGRWLILSVHRRRHAAQLRRILTTHDRFVMFGPPNLDELRYFVPEFDLGCIALIPNSIPKVADHLPKKDKRILWVGRVARAQKRVELIPEIWRSVSAMLPNWELDVVGDGPDLEWLKSQAEVMGLQRINFHGRQVPNRFFEQSAIYLMTSSFEGFPNTLVEAQSQGAVPVIFDSYPVARWIVQQGENGYLVDSFNTSAMSRKIIELATSTELEKMGAQAIQSVKKFHIECVGRLWEALIEEELIRRSVSNRGKSNDDS